MKRSSCYLPSFFRQGFFRQQNVTCETTQVNKQLKMTHALKSQVSDYVANTRGPTHKRHSMFHEPVESPIDDDQVARSKHQVLVLEHPGIHLRQPERDRERVRDPAWYPGLVITRCQRSQTHISQHQMRQEREHLTFPHSQQPNKHQDHVPTDTSSTNPTTS